MIAGSAVQFRSKNAEAAGRAAGQMDRARVRGGGGGDDENGSGSVRAVQRVV